MRHINKVECVRKPTQRSELDGQALTALGAACVNHSTTATGLHTNQKAMGAGAADFGGLVSAFHFGIPN